MMPALEIFVFLLGLSLVSCVNFTTVYEWGELELDYEWPTEAIRRKALQNGSFKPENFEPRYLAVYKERHFLSLARRSGILVTLVSLPTSSVNSAPPKLAPFPNWHFHEGNNCDIIYNANGIEVDSNGHLWVVDADERPGCKPKLWIFDLNDGDKTILVHHFDSPVTSYLVDIVIDQTPDNKQFGYITTWSDDFIIVFNRDKNESWTVETPGKRLFSIALSHREQERRLYLSEFDKNAIYSVSVLDFRSGNQTATPEFMGNWTEKPIRMLIDSANVLYAAFLQQNYLSTWNISEPFSEQRIYEQANGLDDIWPFAFAFDATGTFWMTELYETGRQPRHKLLNAAVGAGSYLHIASPAAVSPGPSTPSITTPVPALKPDDRFDGYEQIAEAIVQISDFVNKLVHLVRSFNFANDHEATGMQGF